MTSLNNTHPACRADSLVYGYGFIFAWLTFVFYFFGCAVILFYNIRELPEFMIGKFLLTCFLHSSLGFDKFLDQCRFSMKALLSFKIHLCVMLVDNVKVHCVPFLISQSKSWLRKLNDLEARSTASSTHKKQRFSSSITFLFYFIVNFVSLTVGV